MGLKNSRMAEETITAASGTPAPAAEVAVSDVAETVVVGKETTVTTATPEPEPDPVPVPEAEKPAEDTEVVLAAKVAEEEKVAASASFKEETNVVEELPDRQKKAIDELKKLVREALAKHEFTVPPPPPPPVVKEEEEKKPETEEPKAEVTTEEPKTETSAEETKPEPAGEETKTEAAAEETKPEEEKKEPEAVPPPPSAAEEPPKAEKPAEQVEEKNEGVPPPTETPEPSVPVTKVEEKVEPAAEEIKETIVEETTTAAVTTEPAEEAPKEEAVVEDQPKEPEEISLWGIPLLADERSDVILLKFLRARDFKVKEAFAMLKSVVAWRKEFGIDKLLEEEGIGNGLEKTVYTHGVDKDGHPVCYNVYGEFQDKEIYQMAFGDAEKRSKFLRWRIQFLENSIRKLDFTPDGVNTIVQINDLQNSPGWSFFKNDFRLATNQAVQLLQDNYPEFVAKEVFINVPWWYVAYNRLLSPFLTQRTKSKFVFVGPSKTTETLFKYIAPEQVPVQYGGLSNEGGEFTVSETATEETLRPSSKQVVEFQVTEGTLVWEARVIGWEVSYGAEFIPSADGGYTVIVQKSRKIAPTDEPVINGSYKIREPGKIVLTFDNQTSKKKKLLYRSKTKSA